MTVYNCHIHTFTHKHVPEDFLPGNLVARYRDDRNRARLIRYLEQMFPGDNDLFDRLATYAELTYYDKQLELFERVRAYYKDTSTRFVVLPMDMSQMRRGPVMEGIRKQHKELAELRDQYPKQVIPFAHVDPRREDLKTELRHAIETLGFRGIKVYPPLGYAPTDPSLAWLFGYAQKNNLPVMTHCSKGGVRRPYGLGYTQAVKLRQTRPSAWRPVLEKFPELRVCLGHFGGDAAWDEYLNPVHPSDTMAAWNYGDDENWVEEIISMVKVFPNLYTDVSYSIFDKDIVKPLKKILRDPDVRKKVLYGSDFYMSEQEKRSETKVFKGLKSRLGDQLFNQIAEVNPVAWLGRSD